MKFLKNKKIDYTITEMVSEELESISKIKDISQTLHKFYKLQLIDKRE